MNYYIKATDNEFKEITKKIKTNLPNSWIENPNGFIQKIGQTNYVYFDYIGDEFEKVHMQIAVNAIDNVKHCMIPVPIHVDKLDETEHNMILRNFIRILTTLNIVVEEVQ